MLIKVLVWFLWDLPILSCLHQCSEYRQKQSFWTMSRSSVWFLQLILGRLCVPKLPIIWHMYCLYNIGAWCRGFGGESGIVSWQKAGGEAAVFGHFSGGRLSNRVSVQVKGNFLLWRLLQPCKLVQKRVEINSFNAPSASDKSWFGPKDVETSESPLHGYFYWVSMSAYFKIWPSDPFRFRWVDQIRFGMGLSRWCCYFRR